MMDQTMSIFYLILAILGLGLLIFIHELGHYLMARRVKMNVEVFSIGFGPPLHKWQYQGVQWQFCLLPFGGYVRIAGMDHKKGVDPHQVEGGYYSKKPWDRIKVALAGPIVNIIFAFFVFCLIWAAGGQHKPFQEFTQIIGYVDSDSSLYSQGIRPGDQFQALDGKPVTNYQDLAIHLLLEEKAGRLDGVKVDYLSGKKEPFSAHLPAPTQGASPLAQLGIIPAQYLIFQDVTSNASPLKGSGIEKGDRIVWVNGELVFSREQLSALLNDSKALLTIERREDGKTRRLFVRVPRLKISDLCLTPANRDELSDWQHEAGLSSRLQQLDFIPYRLSHDATVESSQTFLDCFAQKVEPMALQSQDQIVAVDGLAVKDAPDLLKKLQTPRALVIVEREAIPSALSWKNGDTFFQSSLHPQALGQMLSSMDSKTDHLLLLPPVPLKSLAELEFDTKTRTALSAQYEMQKQQIEKTADAHERQKLLTLLEQSQKRLMLGAVLQDRLVSYNPRPTTLFAHVFDQTWKTLVNLISGNLSAKSLTGPVGIVQALQTSWATGLLNALYWLGFVSLNLAILNLLPIPVLDGGHILFAAIEGVTGKPIKAKTMERFIFPFLILLVILFIYLTYHDIARLLHRLF
jgi:regulator of sigma E protease